MTDKEIIIQALRKAISNGCKYSTYDIDVDLWLKNRLYFSVIFDHDFAKAFWGGNLCHPQIGTEYGPQDHVLYGSIKIWEYHLQKIVLESKPLKYLERFL